MKYVAAGLISVILALIWQRFLLWNDVHESIRVGFWIPIGEEIIKSGTALLFNIPIMPVYFMFGLGEGFYEAFRGWVKPRMTFIFAGLLTHLLFGAFFILPVFWGFSLIFAIMAHIIWNNIIIRVNRVI